MTAWLIANVIGRLSGPKTADIFLLQDEDDEEEKEEEKEDEPPIAYAGLLTLHPWVVI